MSAGNSNQPVTEDLEPEVTQGYRPPEQKTVEEILKADENDESLKKYKSLLLGEGPNKEIPFPDDKRNVIVSKLSIVVENRPDVEIDLKGNIENLKKKPVVLKEGSKYRVKIEYYVQREIVSGLKYIMASYRGPLRVDKADVMLGSYGPRSEPHVWISPEEMEAPQGLVSRGTYVIKSRFIDDDKTDHLIWEWAIKITNNWDSAE
jgi:Rho GDP-dissociation inhibitor